MHQGSKLRLAQIQVLSNSLNIQGVNSEDPGCRQLTTMYLSRFPDGRKQLVE